MDIIYHITTPAAWEAAQSEGKVVADSLAAEGFIHCSRQHQLLQVASRFFANADEMFVLAIDAAAVGAWLVSEGPVGAGDPFADDVFPHVYAPIPCGAVVATAYLRRDPTGAYVWPPELPCA